MYRCFDKDTAKCRTLCDPYIIYPSSNFTSKVIICGSYSENVAGVSLVLQSPN